MTLDPMVGEVINFMAYTIAVAGKGGTGKTTISAMIIEYLRAKNRGPILAIDADPNANLNQSLGIELYGTVVGILDKMTASKDTMPAGVSKDRFIEYEVQDSLTEGEGFDLLAMGRPEGPGCYCYANSVLRGIIERLTKAYGTVVMDNEAGMEHLSRRISRSINTLYIVSDFSRVGMRCAKRISDLVKELKIKVEKEYLIVNMARGNIQKLEPAIEESGLKLAGFIPYAEDVEELSLGGKPVTELSQNSEAVRSVHKICEETIGG